MTASRARHLNRGDGWQARQNRPVLAGHLLGNSDEITSPFVVSLSNHTPFDKPAFSQVERVRTNGWPWSIRKVISYPFLGAGALVLSLSAFASDTMATCTPPANTPNHSASINAAFRQEADCRKSPTFLHYLGRLLNQAQRYVEAIERLEAALMYQPDAWATQLEYAIALAGVGDHATSSSLLHAINANPAVDVATQQEIKQLLARKPPKKTPHHIHLGLATGHDNNLLGSAHQETFDLTLPSGRLPVQISPEQQPRAGSFIRTSIQVEGPLATSPDSRWDYTMLGSFRWSTEYAAANLSHWGLSLERSSTQQRGAYQSAQFQRLNQHGGSALNQSQFAFGFDFPGPLLNQSCHYRTGAEFHYTAYSAAGILNGYYSGLLTQVSCPSNNLRIQLRLGRDTPKDKQRAGGAQMQYLLRVAKNTVINDAVLAAEAEYFQQEDGTGYSPLLEDNARRRLQRNTYRLEYRWPWRGVSPYLGVEWLEQRANLPLFAVRNQIFTLGLRTTW